MIDAFNDVQRARADQERARNEAEAYANDILPRARGDAERIRQDAEAYKTQVVNLAQGDASAFLSRLRELPERQGGHRLAPLSRQRRRSAAQGDQGHLRHFGQGRLERRALHAGHRDARPSRRPAGLGPARDPAERCAARRRAADADARRREPCDEDAPPSRAGGDRRRRRLSRRLVALRRRRGRAGAGRPPRRAGRRRRRARPEGQGAVHRQRLSSTTRDCSCWSRRPSR